MIRTRNHKPAGIRRIVLLCCLLNYATPWMDVLTVTQVIVTNQNFVTHFMTLWPHDPLTCCEPVKAYLLVCGVHTLSQTQWIQTSIDSSRNSSDRLAHSAYTSYIQWHRQLWGTGARAPPRLPTIHWSLWPTRISLWSKSYDQLSKYCVVCEISWCRRQQITALSVNIALVTKLLVIEH